MTDDNQSLLTILRILEQHLPPAQRLLSGRERKRAEVTPIIHSVVVAKAFFRITNTSGLIQRLKSDSSLPQICGFVAIPSAAAFSHLQEIFTRHHIMEQLLYRMLRDYHDGLIVGHGFRDSTAISTREKPVNKRRKTYNRRKRRIVGSANTQ